MDVERKQNEREKPTEIGRYIVNSMEPETIEKNVCCLSLFCNRTEQRCLQIVNVCTCMSVCMHVFGCFLLYLMCIFFYFLDSTATEPKQRREKKFLYQMCFSVHFKWV